MQNQEMKMPVHISFIMDGNGRWAKTKMKERLFGHNEGVNSVRECYHYGLEHGIRYMSFFAFSEENWARPKEEVEGLMSLMMKGMASERETLRKNNTVFRVIGDFSRLPEKMVSLIKELESETASNTGMTFIVVLSYSGKWDIVQAAAKYARRVLEAGEMIELSEDDFSHYLSTDGIPEPDLLIRTSGEKRISNFLLWQCAYTEFYFTPVLWPDFRKAELELAIKDFNQRERRYGKVE